VAEDKQDAIRAAIDAIPGSPANMPAETCIEIALQAEGFHVVPGAELPVNRWNADKKHRCPRCHAVTIDVGPPRSWRVYRCCRCATLFTRWPLLAWLLPDARVYCSECQGA
jgi:hypothetical protein